MDPFMYDGFRLAIYAVSAIGLGVLAWNTYKHFVEHKEDTFKKIKELIENNEPKSATEKQDEYDKKTRGLVRWWLAYGVVIGGSLIAMQYMIPSAPKMSKRSTQPAVNSVDKAPDKMVPPIKRTLSDAEREKANQEKYDANRSHIPTGQ